MKKNPMVGMPEEKEEPTIHKKDVSKSVSGSENNRKVKEKIDGWGWIKYGEKWITKARLLLS